MSDNHTPDLRTAEQVRDTRIDQLEKALHRIARLLDVNEDRPRLIWSAIEEARVAAYMALEEVAEADARVELGLDAASQPAPVPSAPTDEEYVLPRDEYDCAVSTLLLAERELAMAEGDSPDWYDILRVQRRVRTALAALGVPLPKVQS